MAKTSLPSLWFTNVHPEVVSKVPDENHNAGELEKFTDACGENDGIERVPKLATENAGDG